ncbi:MAG: response regulator [Bacteroidia bacterium]|nr:response regulator [Bacteroidia bacterium]
MNMKRENSLKVLVIDQDPVAFERLEETLSNLGHQIFGPVANYTEALKFIEKDTPQLIISEIRIQADEDGLQIVRQISQLHQIPVIYYTNAYSPEIFTRALKTPMLNYLIKDELRDTKGFEIMLHRSIQRM